MTPCGLSNTVAAIKIRDANYSDRDGILAIDEIAQCEQQRIDFIERFLGSETCLVADSDGTVVAYAVLEYSFFGNGFISMVYVAKSARRQGVGQSLMRALATQCKTSKLFTSTNESNSAMRALLATLGYVPSGVIENLDPNDPELVFLLNLDRRGL